MLKRHPSLSHALLASALLLAGLAQAEPAALDDTELADVSGRHGALLNISLRNNVNVDTSGTLTPIGCTLVVNTPNPCRFGLEFAARSGVWLMLKEFYGTLEIKDMRLDAGFLPQAVTDDADASRFRDTGNNCLILVAGCTPRSTSTTNFPVVKVTYPNADTPATYDDLHSFLNIGRAWLEFDNGATPGYQRDTSTNSAFGVRMSDSRSLNHAADMRLRGTGYVFGF